MTSGASCFAIALLLAACFQDQGPEGRPEESSDSQTTVAVTSAEATATTGGTTGAATTDAGSTSPGTTGSSTGVTTTSTTSASSATEVGSTSSPETGDDECVSPMADCDGDPAGVCEVNTDTDLQHCGQCDSPCDGECSDGACWSSRYVFITNVAATGFAGVDTVDSFCNNQAGFAGLPGTYAAWISDANSSPATRFTHSTVPYVLLNDLVVANDWADLTNGSIKTRINVSEFENIIEGGCSVTGVWTATTPSGGYAGGPDCEGWTTNEDQISAGVLGSAGESNSKWTEGGCSERSCGEAAHVYCFQQ